MSAKTLFSTVEAAEYLGLTSRRSVRYHIYTTKLLKPDYRIGKGFVFTKDTLDDFNKKRRVKDAYTVAQAAEYLGRNVAWIRHHVYKTRLLKPFARHGRNVVFSKKALDALAVKTQDIPRRRGRDPAPPLLRSKESLFGY